MHVHNEINFPQAKPDSEINVRFLLNEHGDLYFLLLNNSVHIILFNLKNKIKRFHRTEKKRYRPKRAQNRYSGMQIITAKRTTMRTVYVQAVSNSVISRQILNDIVPYA